ncbi:MAG: hypothetical protein Q8Q92_01875 [bacterium]|nr:hypothetical protein [bacterium]
MDISQKQIDDMKELYRKEGKEISDTEASEAAYNLANFAELIWDISKRDAQLKHRLKKEPGGFPVEGNYSCLICGNSINSETGWYDNLGQKCLFCTKAVKDGIIPAFVCENRDSYYSMWHLKDKFGIKTPTAKKLVKDGKLKARIILTADGRPHEYIFLKKENLELIDPDRDSPARKSYDRNRDRVSAAWSREEIKKLRAERKKKRK